MARQRTYQRITRRDLLRRGAGAAVALPTMAAILAACSKPGTTTGGGDGGAVSSFQPARPDSPVTLPLHDDLQPIESGLDYEKGSTLNIYNWDAYMWKKVLDAFGTEFEVEWEWTTFLNIAESVQKLSSGQVGADVYFPTVDVLGKLVAAKIIQPLNHDYIPNLDGVYWPTFQDPFYDQGWRYTVPYTIYTTGIGYRRDFVSDEEVAEQGYEIFWNPKYKGKIGIYNDYREALSLAMLRRGVEDVNTGDPRTIEQAKNDLVELIELNNIRNSINGAYAKLPEGEYHVHQAWSGDMIGAQWYLPKGTSSDVLGYWYPPEGGGLVGNDTITVLASSENPVLAHHFLNFFLSKRYGFMNFTWNGYQPPQTWIEPDTLIADGYVPESLPAAIVTEDHFTSGKFLLELSPEVDALWQDAWDEFKAGG